MTTRERSTWRRIGWIVALLVMAAFGAFGLWEGSEQIPRAMSGMQRAVGIGQIVYGVLGISAAVAIALGWRWGTLAALGWATSCTFVATLAPIAYAPGQVTTMAVLAGALATALIGLAIVWVATRWDPSSAMRVS